MIVSNTLEGLFTQQSQLLNEKLIHKKVLGEAKCVIGKKAKVDLPNTVFIITYNHKRDKMKAMHDLS